MQCRGLSNSEVSFNDCTLDTSIPVVESPRYLTEFLDRQTGEVLPNPRDTRPLLYISGPIYSEGVVPLNIAAACYAAQEAYNRGWAPVIPHLDVFAQMITGVVTRARYMDVDLSLIRACRAVCVLHYELEVDAAGKQTGTSEELDFAEDIGCTIYTLASLPYVN